MIALALLALSASAEDAPPAASAPETAPAAPAASVTVDPSPYPGAFDRAPAFHFKTRLPGPRLNSATHSEWSTPVLFGDWVVLGSASGHALYALSRRDGSVVREFPAEAAVEAPAVVLQDRVFFSDSGGNTFAYTLDGTLLWKHDGNAPVLVSPTVTSDGTRVIVTNVDDLAIALDTATGELVWQYRAKRDMTRQAELSLYAAPRALIVEGGASGPQVILGFSSGTLVAVDLATGEELWKRTVGEGRYPDLVSDPVVLGSDLFSSGYFLPLVAIDLPTHNVRWRLDVGAARAPRIVQREGQQAVLYHPGSDGKLRAVATVTGAELWTWDSGTSGALTSPVPTDAGLIVGSSEGAVYLIDEATGSEIWRWHEPWLLRGLSAEPVVEGRQLMFVTNAGFLYSLLVPQRSPPREAPWP